MLRAIAADNYLSGACMVVLCYSIINCINGLI